VKLGQDSDRFCAKIKANLRGYKDYYLDADGVLYRKETNGKSRLVIPEELVHRIIGDHHKPRYAAHPGVKRNQQWLRRLYYWPSLHRDIEECILNCDACARWRSGRPQVAHIGSLPEANEPREVAFIDITGPYATTPRGNKYLLT
jgi:hypothetical protein